MSKQIRLKRLASGVYETADGRFRVQRQKYDSTYWSIADSQRRLPKSLVSADSLLEARGVIQDWYEHEAGDQS